VFASGALYTAGRLIAYLVLAVILVAGVLTIPEVSRFLQKYMNQILGPILILVGMFLLELISFGSKGSNVGDGMQKRVDRLGIWGALPLGLVFALSFCPVSAALFFGSLLPLAIKNDSTLILPLAYGLGTALPVLIFAILIATGTRYLGKAFAGLARIEWWLRRVTGVVFILAGIYYCLAYIFGVALP
jgi:cytochrome c biogenesis protein CcdA